MNLLWKEPLCLRKHVLLPEAASCSLTRHPDHPALLITSRPFPLTSAARASLLLSGSVSRGICIQLYFTGYLERQLPKSVSLPSRGIGTSSGGKQLEVYCPGRYARETKAECGRDILVGKDSDDERTIVGLEPADSQVSPEHTVQPPPHKPPPWPGCSLPQKLIFIWLCHTALQDLT